MNHYRIYADKQDAQHFVGTFTSTQEHEYTLPEIEKLTGLKDIIVIPHTVHNEYMTAIGLTRRI